MSDRPGRKPKSPPEISPYLFPVLLAGFGLWCAYDGWLNGSPEMQDHLLFNRLASGVLLPWAVIDYLRLKKREKRPASQQES